MKFVIASDIHGSYEYCKKIIEAFEREKADRMILLGDLLYHGPRNDLPDGYAPKKVIECLNQVSENLICVRGNCEAEVDQMVLDFPVMAEYGVFQCGKRMLFATHGHHFSPQQLPKLHQGDIFLFGHTHIPMLQVVDGIICMNPGSVSIPKEGSEHSYMTWEDHTFIWKNLDGVEYKRTVLDEISLI